MRIRFVFALLLYILSYNTIVFCTKHLVLLKTEQKKNMYIPTNLPLSTDAEAFVCVYE